MSAKSVSHGVLGVLSLAVMVGVAVAVPALPVSAAVIFGSVQSGAAVTGPINLTTEGTVDWAIWNYTLNPISGTDKTIAPSNRKVNVAAAIGSATTLVGAGRGTTASSPTLTYSYTDGTGPTTLTNATQGELFDSTLNNAGAGYTFTIKGGAAGVTEVIKLFLTGFDTKPTLTVSAPGATSYTDNSVTYPSTSRIPVVYTINFTPDNTGDLLTVKYQSTTNGTTGSANADLQAVTVGIAPEPASMGVVMVGAVGLLVRRRRR